MSDRTWYQERRMAALEASARVNAGTTATPEQVVAEAAIYEKYLQNGAGE